MAPATVLAVKFNVEPAQIGLLLPAVGATGIGLTTTTVVPAGPGHPATVTVTEYVPASATIALAIVGFCEEDEKLLGPVQLYVAPAIVLAAKFNTEPAQTGLLLLAAGAAGVGFTTTVTVPTGPGHPPTLAVTEYVPDAKGVAPAMEGFCNEELNPLGPVHEYVAPAIVLAVRLSVEP